MSAGGAVLGFDYGARRLGVAVGQTITASARPLATLAVTSGEPEWARVDEFIAAWRPHALVVGLPAHLDQREHELAAPVRAFAAQLQRRYELPVHLIDERLSSHEAQERAAARGRRGAPRSRAAKEEVDRIAAQVILESWLTQQSVQAAS